MLTNTTKVTVRYGETDQMGVVYHANYVVWCEIGRTKLIEDLGFKYADMEERGVVSPVTNINLNYLYPAKYGEDVTVNTWIEQYNGLRVTYGYRIENSEGELCVEGTSEHVCVDARTFRPVAIKKKFPDWHEAYEKNKK
ncbi:acyl-CoA thioesterase [Salipaludibacillus aurantiacus]|uniref:Acyl-CoA thioester hydrolase n=1 Tax=Salipaludibacillus aurantiacus TaxID=1601833 RepID=A0A1H9WD20_9BACI|nr:thioesterase family protein [Salipaludibacillus aurantiacus]SES31800.1 acyl-CoA thioester hydrolase [Salipaludibacillus aurantiacus]